MKLKCEWNMDMSLDLLRMVGCWPDSIDASDKLLKHAYKYIEYFIGDGMVEINRKKQIVKNSFNKNYNL